MIEIQVFGMMKTEEGATIAEYKEPEFFDILVTERDEDGDLIGDPIEEIEDLTWEQAMVEVEKLEAKYGEEAEYVGCR